MNFASSFENHLNTFSHPSSLSTYINHSSNNKNTTVEANNTLWMGDLEHWMDEAFIQHVWLQYVDRVVVKTIRDKFTGYNLFITNKDFPLDIALWNLNLQKKLKNVYRSMEI
jgi:hypothetical protein